MSDSPNFLRTVGELRRALLPFADDCKVLVGVDIEFHLDLDGGSWVEVITEDIDLHLPPPPPHSAQHGASE